MKGSIAVAKHAQNLEEVNRKLDLILNHLGVAAPALSPEAAAAIDARAAEAAGTPPEGEPQTSEEAPPPPEGEEPDADATDAPEKRSHRRRR